MSEHPYPRLRLVAVAWLLVYVPTYAAAYDGVNFLFLCNIGVLLTAAGLISGNRLLVSSQAVAAPVIGLAWGLDVFSRMLTGSFLFGATAYMWDPQFPLTARLLSLYHLLWPPLVVWCVKTEGYDRRGWLLQTALAGVTLGVVRRFTDPALNINFAFADPFFGLQLGPAPLHLAIVLMTLSCIAYGSTHWFLTRILRCPQPPLSSDPADRETP